MHCWKYVPSLDWWVFWINAISNSFYCEFTTFLMCLFPVPTIWHRQQRYSRLNVEHYTQGIFRFALGTYNNTCWNHRRNNQLHPMPGLLHQQLCMSPHSAGAVTYTSQDRTAASFTQELTNFAQDATLLFGSSTSLLLHASFSPSHLNDTQHGEKEVYTQ